VVADREWIGVELVSRPVLHGAHHGRETGLVAFGRPFTTAFDPDAAPGTIRSYVSEHRGVSDFRRLVLHLNLTPRQGEPFTHVVVRATAQPADNSILFLDAWPLREEDTGSHSSRISAGPGFGPLQAQAETTRQHSTATPWLRARGLGTSSVQWEFTGRAGRELDGAYELSSTVELPRGTSGGVLLSAAAGVSRKRLGVIGFRAELPAEVAVVPLP
jgi:hypothetical protein